MPLPSLPLLSAMSCSSQSPKFIISSDIIKVSLSSPLSASVPNNVPRCAGLFISFNLMLVSVS